MAQIGDPDEADEPDGDGTVCTCRSVKKVVKGTTMYLRVPGVVAAGSKESFMLLLDFAEERLGCDSCIICVLKTRPDRATLLRTFMFMGFQLLPPRAPAAADIDNPDYIFLHYNMQ